MSDVRQLRVVVQVDDYDEALRFYRDVLGLVEQQAFHGEDGARVAILHAGAATLELANRAQVRMIDRIETDGDRSDRIRLAFEVDDTRAVAERLAGAGARISATPRETPWRSINARLRSPGDLQVTLFQELESIAQRADRDGFRTEPAGDDDVSAVLALEQELQTIATRRDPARLAELLAPDFVEIGASGHTWDRAAIIELLTDGEAGEAPIEVHGLGGRVIGPGMMQATWISVRADRRAQRASLWRRDPAGWRLVHHQGTPLSD